MYNRYTPSPDGTFQRTVVPDAPSGKNSAPAPPPEPPRMERPMSKPPEIPPRPPAQKEPCASPPALQKPPPLQAPAACPPDRPLRKLLPPGLDAGDLLVLMETDEDDSLTLLLTVAAVMLL